MFVWEGEQTLYIRGQFYAPGSELTEADIEGCGLERLKRHGLREIVVETKASKDENPVPKRQEVRSDRRGSAGPKEK
jgi:hypothetical protein